MNAIGRLTQMAALGERAAAELVWAVPNINWREDVAAVDALYQAAAHVVDTAEADEGCVIVQPRHLDALAAVVRRVESCETREGE